MKIIIVKNQKPYERSRTGLMINICHHDYCLPKVQKGVLLP